MHSFKYNFSVVMLQLYFQLSSQNKNFELLNIKRLYFHTLHQTLHTKIYHKKDIF